VETTDRSADWSRIEPFSPYGCNMAFRLSAIGDLRFDERLVLYGWLEDRDFGAALAKRGGRLIKCASARGVHMGVKSGRVAGDRLGYSQVVNPIYMLRKGTMTAGQVAGQLFRNIMSNLVFAVRPEPFIDRRGRLRGNFKGFLDVLRGRLEPERAAAIRPPG
jgi:GT2 family glycosyltransferase